LSDRGRHIAVGTHRALALGEPLPDHGIAALTRLTIAQVREEIASEEAMGSMTTPAESTAPRSSDHRR
jgi:hypothetical protein